MVWSCGTTKRVTPSTETSSPIVVSEESKDTVIVKLPVSVEKVTVGETKVDSVSIDEIIATDPIMAEVFNHSAWDMLLKDHVSETGVVDYESFRVNKGRLWDYIASLGANMPDDSWSKEDKLAYWMNAYNAMTVDLIIKNLPLKSIKDIDKPWNQSLWKLGPKWYNLDEIEHKILRKMGDARIHFGINCASFSCPPLLNEAFTSQKVDDQLDRLARNFINDPKRNIISEDHVQLSKIFSWFAKDFKTEGSVIDYVAKYSEKTINPKARKTFLDYDWSLNN